MVIKRRFPNCFTGFEETIHEASNKEELLSIDWIKDLLTIPNHLGMFFSESSGEDRPSFLMSLAWGPTDKRVIYFVVGLIFGDPLELGLEEYTEFIKKYEHGENN